MAGNIGPTMLDTLATALDLETWPTGDDRRPLRRRPVHTTTRPTPVAHAAAEAGRIRRGARAGQDAPVAPAFGADTVDAEAGAAAIADTGAADAVSAADEAPLQLAPPPPRAGLRAPARGLGAGAVQLPARRRAGLRTQRRHGAQHVPGPPGLARQPGRLCRGQGAHLRPGHPAWWSTATTRWSRPWCRRRCWSRAAAARPTRAGGRAGAALRPGRAEPAG